MFMPSQGIVGIETGSISRGGRHIFPYVSGYGDADPISKY